MYVEIASWILDADMVDDTIDHEHRGNHSLGHVEYLPATVDIPEY